jgi:hypothetical protein
VLCTDLLFIGGVFQMTEDLPLLISLIVTGFVMLGAVVIVVLVVMAGGKDKK